MKIGLIVSVIALGAILTFATHVHTAGFSVRAVGAVLMLVGVISLALRLASLAKQRELTAEQALAPEEAVLVRPADTYGTTAEPVPPRSSPYQSAEQWTGEQW